MSITCWRFNACQIGFSYFTKLGTMFTVWNIPPATRSNGKQNIQFQNKIAILFDVLQSTRPPTPCYKLLLGQFRAEELHPTLKRCLPSWMTTHLDAANVVGRLWEEVLHEFAHRHLSRTEHDIMASCLTISVPAKMSSTFKERFQTHTSAKLVLLCF